MVTVIYVVILTIIQGRAVVLQDLECGRVGEARGVPIGRGRRAVEHALVKTRPTLTIPDTVARLTTGVTVVRHLQKTLKFNRKDI